MNPVNGQTELRRSAEIKVGDILLIHDDEAFPADLILLMCAKPESARYCYVETANLDG